MNIDAGKYLMEEDIKEWKQKLKKDKNNADLWAMLGHKYAGYRRDKEAVDAFGKALKINPRHVSSLSELARIYSTHEKYDKAIAACRRVAELAPNNGMNWYILSQLLMQQKKHEEAAEALKQCIENEPENSITRANSLVMLGDLYELLGRDFEAMDAYGRNLKMNSQNWAVHFKLGSVLRKHGRHNEALESFRISAQIRPDCTEAWLYIGATLVDQQLYAEALGPIERVLRSEPENCGALYFRAIIHIANGEASEAKESLKKAKKKAKQVEGLSDLIKDVMKTL